MVQRYYSFEGAGVQISEKKRYVTLETPLQCNYPTIAPLAMFLARSL